MWSGLSSECRSPTSEFVLETERLRLPRITLAELDELIAIHAEPAVARFMGPFDRAEAARWFDRNQQEWGELGYGRLGIVERTSRRFLGRSGLKYWPQFDETEVGWMLRSDVWGQGFATEAGRACLEWGFQEFEFPYITAMIRPDNDRSARVAERLGMTPLRTDVLLGQPVIVYSVERDRWRARPPG